MNTGTAASVRRRAPVLLAVLGALAGTAAKAADESPWTWAADLGTYPAAWVLAVALIGRQAPAPGAAAVWAAVLVVPMAWLADRGLDVLYGVLA